MSRIARRRSPPERGVPHSLPFPPFGGLRLPSAAPRTCNRGAMVLLAARTHLAAWRFIAGEVLEGVTPRATLPEGALVAASAGPGLVGESGSGKSMTALAVMGLLPQGAARRRAASPSTASTWCRSTRRAMCAVRGRDVGMIFQEPMTALNPLQTIGDQVAETVRVHGAAGRAEARAIAAATLARVGLPPARFPLTRYPHELSGGQRQRVGIAMAIALRPKLLIADEPTTALDVTTQAAILALLRRLVDEDGMGLMLITHDLAVVAGLADRVAIMHRGAVVEAGPTGEVLRAMRHPYTRALFAASAHRPARVARLARAPLLEVEGMVREYRVARHLLRPPETLRAVDGVSLAVRAGESVGLVGE